MKVDAIEDSSLSCSLHRRMTPHSGHKLRAIRPEPSGSRFIHHLFAFERDIYRIGFWLTSVLQEMLLAFFGIFCQDRRRLAMTPSIPSSVAAVTDSSVEADPFIHHLAPSLPDQFPYSRAFKLDFWSISFLLARLAKWISLAEIYGGADQSDSYVLWPWIRGQIQSKSLMSKLSRQSLVVEP